MNPNPLAQEISRAQFEYWLQQDVTQDLLRNLRAIRAERHVSAVAKRAEPAIAAMFLEREFRIDQILEYIVSGHFLLPTNQQTLDRNI